jgi:thiaminase/transcriptional activator TenA
MENKKTENEINQTNKDDNAYQAWIDTYAGEEFATSVAKAIEITNKYAARASAENLKLMEEVFLKTSRLEWMFWDSAYKQEKWAL